MACSGDTSRAASTHKHGNEQTCSLKLYSIARKWPACTPHFHRSGNSAELGLTPENQLKVCREKRHQSSR